MITAGALPFDEPNLGLLFKKIQKADYQTPAWFSRDLAHLLRAIITPDTKARSAPLVLHTSGHAACAPCSHLHCIILCVIWPLASQATCLLCQPPRSQGRLCGSLENVHLVAL